MQIKDVHKTPLISTKLWEYREELWSHRIHYQISHRHTYIYTHTYTHTDRHTYIYICVYIYTHTCAHTHISINKHTLTHIYSIYTPGRTHTQRHRHTHIYNKTRRTENYQRALIQPEVSVRWGRGGGEGRGTLRCCLTLDSIWPQISLVSLSAGRDHRADLTQDQLIQEQLLLYMGVGYIP